MSTDLDHCISCQSLCLYWRVKPIVFSSILQYVEEVLCECVCECQGHLPLLFLKSFPILYFISILKMWPCKSMLISFDKYRFSVRRRINNGDGRKRTGGTVANVLCRYSVLFLFSFIPILPKKNS